jgi:hypothetical protein
MSNEKYLPSNLIFHGHRGVFVNSKELPKLGHKPSTDLTISPIERLGINANGDTLALAAHGKDHFVKVLNLKTGNCQFKIKNTLEKKPYSVLSSSDFLLITDQNWYRLQIHNSQTRKSVGTIDFPYELQAFCFSHDGNHLFTISNINVFQEWDLSTGQSVNECRLKCYPTPITQISIHKNGESFFTCCTDFGDIFEHDLKTGAVINQHKGTTPMIYFFKLFPDGRSIAIRGIENKIEVVDLSTGEIRHTLDCKDSFSNRIYISQDSRKLVSLLWKGTNMLIWDIGKETCREFSSKHIVKPFRARFLNEDTLIIIDEDAKHKLVFIDLQSDRLLGILHNFQKEVLWETAPDNPDDDILFWGEDIDKLIDVAELDDQGGLKDTPLKHTDSRRKAYLQDHLDREAVIARLKNKTHESRVHRQLYYEIKQLTMMHLEEGLSAKLSLPAREKEEK